MNFRDRKARSPIGFQMAPMIDIVFILLSFFIATQIYARWEREIDIRLPTAETGGALDRLPGEIIVNVLPDGLFVVNRRTMRADDLQGFLKQLAELFPGQPIVIRADRATAYEHVVQALDLCRQSDIWNIRFSVDASPRPTAPTETTAAPLSGALNPAPSGTSP